MRSVPPLQATILRRAAQLAAWALLCSVCGKGALAASAADSAGFTEYQLKAGYLYNFITYTEWPAAVGKELRLCVYGEDPFGAELDKLAGKMAGERSLAIARLNSVEATAACQVIYVSTTVVGNLDRLLAAIQTNPVLVVADSPGAARAGAAINMVTESAKVGFEINLPAAKHQGLNLSYRLLRLAREVQN